MPSRRTTAVAYRSQFKPLLRLAQFAPFSAALLSAIAGCQSNAQQDLVARELRMQEDQIYALEDYLAEYQQLICKYRSENEALRQQLAGDEEPLPPRQTPRSRNGTSPTLEDPEIDVPPGTDTTPPEIEVPDVPPLEGTSSSGRTRDVQLAGHERDASLAAGDSIAASLAAAVEPTLPQQLVQDVWLHGDVVENDTGGGPRLAIAIEPLDGEGRNTAFSGSISLMLLAPDDAGGKQSLARWDFPPEEVQSALVAGAGDSIIRFYLELEPDTPFTENTQLWVRLLPHGGDKVLSFADIDLHEPGSFSSFHEEAVAHERSEAPPVADTIPDQPISNTKPVVQAELIDAGWSTALPGAPAGLETAPNKPDAQWRASTEPMPVAVSHSTPARPKRRLNPPAPRRKTPKPAVAATRRPKGWSPDRLQEAPAATPHTATATSRPRWSATR
jgi:hypothetical protein